MSNHNLPVYLVDTATDLTLFELVSGGSYQFTGAQLEVMGLYTVLPSGHPLEGQVQSAVLSLDGIVIQTENTEPYALFGDKDGDFHSGSIPAGEHTLTIELYSEKRGAGTLLDTQIVSFTLVDQAATDDLTTTETITPIFIDVLANDGGDKDSSTIEIVSGPQNGAIQIIDNEIFYTPNSGFTGKETFTYSLNGGASGEATVTVDVLAAAAASGVGAEQIHLAWVDNAATTLTIVWRLDSGVPATEVQYRAVGTTQWTADQSALRQSGTKDGDLYEATLRGLTANTEYEFRVRLDDGSWSEVYDAWTAPLAGQGDFDVVFFADTGLIGRLDGLATGTAQVRDEIAELDPTLLLGGGDYAYFNTDTRFGDLEATIDAWFDQSAPFLSQAPFMTAYGNHEVYLGEGFEEWHDRFPQPEEGDLEGGRFYSFDVAGVHFVSILLGRERDSLTQAQLDWVESDILAAQAAGAEWIIPFMHAAPYSDGENHPSALAARDQFAPIFESLEVDLVLTTHDQSYERTFPLINGSSTLSPTTNVPTTTDLDTYYTDDDGVVWMKVSPGGKISNINGDFSQWMTVPPPDYTAVRNNTLHHYTRLSFDDAGILSVEVFGVVGDGSDPILVDSFQFLQGERLSFTSDDAATTAEETAVLIDVLSNDDPGTTIHSVGAAANGTTAVQDGKILYTPAEDFSGIDSFTYTGLDGLGGTSVATVTVDVTQVNDSPENLALSARFVFESASSGTVIGDLSAFDPDGDTILFTVDDMRFDVNGSNQLVVAAGADLSVDADTDVPIVVTATDGNGGSATLNETVTILDASAIGLSVFFVDTATDLTHFTIVPGETYQFTQAELEALGLYAEIPSSHPFAGQVQSVVLSLDGSVVRTENSSPYALFGDRNGDFHSGAIPAGTHTLTIELYSERNGQGSILNSEVMSFVLVDEAALAVLDDSAAIAEDQSVLIDVLANDGPGVTIDGIGAPSSGTAVIEGDQIRYTPDPDFNGTDSFDYSGIDDGGATASATVTVTVDPVNDDPRNLVLDGNTVSEVAPAGTVIGEIIGTDVDGDTLSYSVDDPRFDVNGSNQLVAAEDADLSVESDTIVPIMITATDGNGGSATLNTSVTIEDEQVADIATDDIAMLLEDQSVLIDVLTNDAPGTSITSFVQGASGTVALESGQLRYTPNPNFNGIDSFEYAVSDGANVDTATVSVTIDPVNDDPEDLSLSGDGTVSENASAGTVIGDLSAFDPDGDTIFFTVDDMRFDVNGSNQLVVAQDADLSVEADTDVPVIVTATDGHGGSATLNETVTILNELDTSNVVTAINVGGEAYSASETGINYAADPGILSGNITYRDKSGNEVLGTEDDALYQTYGFGDFEYAIGVPGGNYVIQLELVEPWWETADQRLFDVAIEGVVASEFDDIDLFALAGGKWQALTLTSMPVSVTDGTLNIDFNTLENHSIVSAITVFQAEDTLV